MRYITLTLLFFISLILQSTLFSHLTIVGVKPDIVLVLIIFYALLHGPKEGALAGLLGGLLQDLLFGQNIGMNILAKLTVGYVFGILERKIYKENVLIPMIALFLGTYVNQGVLYVLKVALLGLRLSGQEPAGLMSLFGSSTVVLAVYNSCLAPFVYKRFYKSSQKGLLRIDT